MDAFSAFSTAPSSGIGAMLPSSHNNGLGAGFSTSTTTTSAGGFTGLGSPAAMGSSGRGFAVDGTQTTAAGGGATSGSGIAGAVSGGGGGGVNLFSTVATSLPKATYAAPAQAGLSPRPSAAEMLLFSTAATTSMSGGFATSPPPQVGHGVPGVRYQLRASRVFDVNDSHTYTSDIHRALERLRSLDGPASGGSAHNRSGAGSAPVLSGAASANGSLAASQAHHAAPSVGGQTGGSPPLPSLAHAPATTAPEGAAAAAFFFTLMDVAQPHASAARVQEALERGPTPRETALKAISVCLTSPAHLAILARLPSPYREQVRDYTLQTVLEQFDSAEHEREPVPQCARMLAEMTQLGLVRLKGVAAAIADLLARPSSRRASIATFGLVAEQNRSSDAFLREMRQLSTTESQLLQLYKDPEYEYDVLAINRLLSASGAEAMDDGQVGTILRQTYKLTRTDTAAPASCLQYVAQRDELFTAHGDGVIALWGASTSSTAHTSTTPEAVVRTIVEMPSDTVAVAMAAPHRGHFIVAAGIPAAVFGPAHPFTAHWQTRHQGRRPTPVALPHSAGSASAVAASSVATGAADASLVASSSAADSANVVCPLLRLLVHSDGTGEWAQGGIIRRPTAAAITAVAAITQNACVCSAESAHDLAGSGQWHHNLTFLNAPTGQVVHTVVDAHTDFITALATCSDKEYMLVSAARRSTVKLWDTRTNGASAAATATASTTAHQSINSVQSDSITSIRTFQNLILTSSLDGSFVVWDTRELSGPVARRQFTSPVLDLTPMEGGKWAVATARGLFLLSDSLHSMDVIPNVAFTQICANHTGELLFAAGADGVSVFSVKK